MVFSILNYHKWLMKSMRNLCEMTSWKWFGVLFGNIYLDDECIHRPSKYFQIKHQTIFMTSFHIDFYTSTIENKSTE